MFASLRKPRWQHSNPDKRRQAIAQLDPGNAEHSEILATLARGDIDSQVRISACRQLTDVRLLDTLIQHDIDPTVQQAAQAQLSALLAGTARGAPSLENRLRLVRLTDNAQVLASVAQHGSDGEIRLTAIQRLQDAALLAELARHGSDAGQRIAAAEQLLTLDGQRDDEFLRELAQHGRDKKVRQLAREYLKQQQQQSQQLQQRQQRAAHLLDELDSHRRRQLDNLYAPRLQQLQQDWLAVADCADSTQQAAGNRLLAACEARLREQQQAAEQAAAVADAERQQQHAISTLADSLAGLANADSWPSANNLQALLASQQQRWQAATEICAAGEAICERFAAQVGCWQSLIECWRAFDNEQPDAQPWPASLPLPPALRQAAASSAAQPSAPPQQAPAASAELDRLLAALAGAINQRKLKLANRLWQKAGFLHAQASAQQQQRLDKLQPRLEELRDWHAFAAEPKKLALCEQMEALIDNGMPAMDKASAIQLLQDQWQELMSADQHADQALWDRFKAASDQAFLPCREHFAELDQQRADNLQKRLALCQQLSHFLDSFDPDHGDWSLAAKVRRQAPQEWKSYHPVRFADLRDASQQFSALLKRLDDLIDQAVQRHQKHYQQLISEAEALHATLAEGADANQACEQCKVLQRRWQQAGWLPQTLQHKLYRQFRRTLDAIFSERQQQQQRHQQAASAEAQAVEQALATLRTALASPIDEAQMQTLRTLADALQALPLAASQRQLLQARQELLREARQRQQRWPAQRQWQQREQRILAAPAAAIDDAQQTLAVALEASAGLDSPASAKDARMQWQLAQLSQAMKQQHGDPRASCQALLDEYPLEQGLADDIRQRLLTVWRQLQAK